MTHARIAAPHGAASGIFSFVPARRMPAWALPLLVLAVLCWSPGALAQSVSLSVTTSYSGNNDPDFNFVVSAGDNIAYQVAVQNTGTVALNNVVVNNPLTSPGSNTCATVNPGAFCVLLGGYLVTLADQAAGSINSTGSATSTEVPGPTVGNTVNTPVITPVPAMTVNTAQSLGSVDADSNGLVTVGDSFNYTVQLTNTGTMPLTSVLVSDSITTLSCPPTVYTNQGCGVVATHVVTLADEAAGSFSIPGSGTSTQIPGPVTSTLNTPVIARVTSMSFNILFNGLVTDADSSGTITAGDTLSYDLRMINTGTQNLTNVVDSAALLTPGSFTCPLVNNSSGCVVTMTHIVTAAEATAGNVSITGSATATEITVPVTFTINTPVAAPPAAMLVAVFNNGSTDPDNNGQATVGDTISYQVQAQNTGTTPLTNVVVSDALLVPSTFTCASVGVGGVCNLSGTYTITVADETAGSITNTGTATSTEVPGPISGTLNTPVVTRTTSLAVSQAVVGNTDPDGNGQISVGDTLTYAVTMLNTGTQPLTSIAVSDPLLTPNSITCPVANTLSACVLNGTYLVTAADATAGSVSSTGSVTTTELPGPFTNTLNSPVATLAASMGVGNALASFADNDGNAQVTSGDVLTYTVTATNTGAAVLTNVVVSDPSIAPASTTCASVLPTQTCALTGTYTVTAADASAGNVTNTGSAVSTQTSTTVSSVVITPVFTIAGPAATTLNVLSGNQQVLAVGTASASMVVELKSAGVPVAGQTINWSASGGSLSTPSSVTDAAGHASAKITLTVVGASTVSATFTGTPSYAAASATFSQNSSIASLPALTPNQHSVAVALDNACAALAIAGTLTPEQQDLLAQCQALTAASPISPTAVATALGQLLPDIAEVQSRTGQAAVAAQYENLKSRMSALRHGSSGLSTGGLTLTGSGGSIGLFGLGAALLADNPPTAKDNGFSRWGLFVSGNIGRGESDPTSLTPRYSFDIEGITIGADYRESDHFVLGAALGYTSQDTDLAAHQGSIAMHGLSLTGYATWYQQDSRYLDSSLSYGKNDFDLLRRIEFSVPLPGGGVAAVDQTAKVATGGSDFSVATTLGRDFHRNAWAFGVYGRALYSRLQFDGFTERFQDSHTGNGLGLRVDAREVTALSSVLGGKLDYVHSTSWGVLMPHFELEWQHEYRSDPDGFRAFLLNDPTGTPIMVVGDAMDASYMRIGVGLSMVLTHGRSAFANYTKVVGRAGLEQDNLALGFRMEF